MITISIHAPATDTTHRGTLPNGISESRRFAFRPRSMTRVLAAATLLAVSCGGGAETTPQQEETPLSALEVIGVDFQLDSILLTNTGTERVRTENLHLCQEEECFEFNVFFIEPRATILFDVSRAGGIDPSGGEIALYTADTYSDPDALIDYVAWGSPGHAASPIAAEALLWSTEDYIETHTDTIILTRIESGVPGSDAWEASNEIS